MKARREPRRVIPPRSRHFNEAASRGQRIRTNRKYPTRQRLRIVLRALPHHDHTRAARLSPARCGRCHHLSARTSSARAALQGRLAPGRAPARPWRRFTRRRRARVRAPAVPGGRPGASTGRRCGCGARWRSACRQPSPMRGRRGGARCSMQAFPCSPRSALAVTGTWRRRPVRLWRRRCSERPCAPWTIRPPAWFRWCWRRGR